MNNLDYFKNLYLTHGVELQNLNIFGIRNEEKQEQDIWNDVIGYFTNDEIKFFRGTTDPGYYWTLNPMNNQGTAHLCLGHHKNIWIIDKHRGKYTALCNRWNCSKTTVWRDRDKDGVFKHQNDKLFSGYFGINLHRASALYLLDKIGRYSAGCQVVWEVNDFMDLIDKAKNSGIRKFDYFLFDCKQIDFFNELLKNK